MIFHLNCLNFSSKTASISRGNSQANWWRISIFHSIVEWGPDGYSTTERNTIQQTIDNPFNRLTKRKVKSFNFFSEYLLHTTRCWTRDNAVETTYCRNIYIFLSIIILTMEWKCVCVCVRAANENITQITITTTKRFDIRRVNEESEGKKL